MITLIGHGVERKDEGREDSLPADNVYTHGMLGSTDDLYIVYNLPFSPNGPHNRETQILESTDVMQLDFQVRAFRGYPKDGIILFQHPGYNGEGKAYDSSAGDITEYFPTAHSNKGVSSMIITQGQWQLYGQKNQGGSPLFIRGETTFGPGRYTDVGPNAADGAGDKVQSIRRIQ